MCRKGSPPPMRGKVGSLSIFAVSDRITPAYAGKSSDGCRCAMQGWDHPRLCGEKQIQIVLVHKRIGSPPPMRGKVMRDEKVAFYERITPAYAGKSHFQFFPFCFFWDHPRLCGEKFPQQPRFCWAAGSPPPMRGKEYML